MSSETIFSIFVSTSIKSIAVLAAAWIVAFLMRGRSAASRHLVWIAAAIGLLLLPFLTIALPQLSMPGGALVSSATAMFQTTVTARPGSQTAVIRETSHANPTTSTAPSSRRTVDWRFWILTSWVMGITLVIARMILGNIVVGRARRRATPFADRALGQELAQTLGISNRVDILESRAGSMPMTIGFLRPAVFLPADAAEWSEDRRRSVLLHELAHISRADVAAQLFARVAFSLYWWNPLAWMAAREMTKERERATDDLVLNAGTRASDYAAHLLEIARTAVLTPSLNWAAIAMARPSKTRRSELEARLIAILDTNANRKSASRAWAWVAAVIGIALVAPLAAVHAQDAKPQTIPADVDAYIRAANSQKNHEMLERAAKAAEDAQKYDTAQALLQSAAAIRATVSGDQSEQYALGLMKLGDLEQKRNNAASATDFYTKAANILGAKPAAIPALMYLGTAAVGRRDFEAAYGFFQRAQNADPVQGLKAYMWMAIVRQLEGKPEDAEALYKLALTSLDPQSLDTANTMQVYAHFLKGFRTRSDEVADLEARAEAIRKAIAPPTVAPTALPAGVYKIGGDVHQPSLISKVEPQYSELARIAGFAGSVSLSIVVGTDGVPTNIQVRRPLGFGLDEKAVEAVGKWVFKPGTKDGQPVPVIAVIDVNFRLL
jgi:TonB family protein